MEYRRSTLAYMRADPGLRYCVHATDAAKASRYKHGIIEQGWLTEGASPPPRGRLQAHHLMRTQSWSWTLCLSTEGKRQGCCCAGPCRGPAA